MATRCNITIKKEGYKDESLYHHHDGYPSGVGVELEDFLKDSSYNTPREMAEALNNEDSHYELDEQIHGDEEYFYTIYMDNETLLCENDDEEVEFSRSYKKERPYRNYEILQGFLNEFNELRENYHRALNCLCYYRKEKAAVLRALSRNDLDALKLYFGRDAKEQINYLENPKYTEDDIISYPTTWYD